MHKTRFERFQSVIFQTPKLRLQFVRHFSFFCIFQTPRFFVILSVIFVPVFSGVHFQSFPPRYCTLPPSFGIIKCSRPDSPPSPPFGTISHLCRSKLASIYWSRHLAFDKGWRVGDKDYRLLLVFCQFIDEWTFCYHYTVLYVLLKGLCLNAQLKRIRVKCMYWTALLGHVYRRVLTVSVLLSMSLRGWLVTH